MLKCLILLSFIGHAFGQWQFNSFEVYENGGSDEFVTDVSFFFVLISIHFCKI